MNRPLIQHKLTIIRKKDTGTNGFRQIAGEISGLMVCEVTCDLPLKNVEIETPIDKTTQKELAGRKLVIVPILGTGLGMAGGVLQMIPPAKVGHIGMYRDEEALRPHEYFFKMPRDAEERDIVIVDPMLVTDDSTNMAIDALKERNAKNIRLAVLAAAPESVKNIQGAHPDVDICAAAEDERLMDNGYIFPGLKDTGGHLSGAK